MALTMRHLVRVTPSAAEPRDNRQRWVKQLPSHTASRQGGGGAVCLTHELEQVLEQHRWKALEYTQPKPLHNLWGGGGAD